MRIRRAFLLFWSTGALFVGGESISPSLTLPLRERGLETDTGLLPVLQKGKQPANRVSKACRQAPVTVARWI